MALLEEFIHLAFFHQSAMYRSRTRIRKQLDCFEFFLIVLLLLARISTLTRYEFLKKGYISKINIYSNLSFVIVIFFKI